MSAETKDNPQPPLPAPDGPTLWTIEYAGDGDIWRTAVEADSREDAMRIFRRDNPGIEIRECWL